MRSSDWISYVCSSDLRIENGPQIPSQKTKERHWRTRADPLEPFWPRIEELLQIDGIIAVTVFETLQDEFGEDAAPDAMRRPLERRTARWRELHGAERENATSAQARGRTECACKPKSRCTQHNKKK